MKLQALQKTWEEGKDAVARVDGDNGVSVSFVRDTLKRVFVIVSLPRKPENPVRVSVSRFFQGTVTEEFSPESFLCIGCVGKNMYFAERQGFPQQIFAEMLKSDTVRVGVEEVRLELQELLDRAAAGVREVLIHERQAGRL